ncbi:MAG: tetratricopeptide repeat protein [Candidatus Sericytochromatia bacterium]
MRIQLQNRVPYQQSLRWQLNLDYYQARGTGAFLNQEVPHDITSNPIFARQIATVLIAAVVAQDLPASEPVRILELGAGLGDFAYHLITAFEALCHEQGLPWAERLEYWLSDISLKSVQSWQTYPVFQAWLAQKRLRLCQLDALDPAHFCEREGHVDVFPAGFFSGVIANYHHCVLPVSLLMLDQGQYYAVESELFAWLAGQPETPAPLPKRQKIFSTLAAELAQWQPEAHFEPLLAAELRSVIPGICQTLVLPAVAQNWAPNLVLNASLVRWIQEACQNLPAAKQLPPADFAQALEAALDLPLFATHSLQQSQLQDVYHPRAVALADCGSDPAAREVLAKFSGQFEKAVLTYPLASMASLRALLPLLKHAGICVLSDKGLYETEQMEGTNWPIPSYHGGSLAQMVNFPFLREWAPKIGFQVATTADPAALIQTQLLCKSAVLPMPLQRAFQQVFIAQNQNQLHTLLLQAGVAFYQQQKYSDALRYYAAARHYGPEDDTSLLFLASTCLALKQPQKAASFLKQLTPSAFQTYTRRLLKAEILFRLKQFPEAIENYLQVLAFLPEEAAVAGLRMGMLYFNLGEAYSQIGQFSEALRYLHKASALMPERQDLAHLIQGLSAAQS